MNCAKSGSEAGMKSLYEQWNEDAYDQDLYDDDDAFDDYGLTNAQIKYANTYDSNLCGQIR